MPDDRMPVDHASDDPQSRSDEAAHLDVRVDLPAREGLTGTAPEGVYAPTRDPDQITIAPDHRPSEEQPRWRRDFPIDWPEDAFVARRDFVKFLVLTSAAFAAGQAWIVAKSLSERQRPAAPERKIASLTELAAGSARTFNYPGEHDPCLLIRAPDGALVAYSQACTHLSCAVVPKIEEGVLHCPCHEGIFDLRSGRNVAGPPPRPLPKIALAVRGDDVYAVAVEPRTV